MEAHAELFDIELAGHPITISCGYLIIESQMLIDLSDIVFLREGVDDALFQLGMIVVVVKQDGKGRLAVATCTTSLLEIGLQRIRTLVVDYQTHIRLVDAHAKGVGGYHDANAVMLPVALSLVLLGMVESGMIESGTETSLRQVFGHLPGMSPTADIDNG